MCYTPISSQLFVFAIANNFSELNSELNNEADPVVVTCVRTNQNPNSESLGEYVRDPKWVL